MEMDCGYVVRQSAQLLDPIPDSAVPLPQRDTIERELDSELIDAEENPDSFLLYLSTGVEKVRRIAEC